MSIDIVIHKRPVSLAFFRFLILVLLSLTLLSCEQNTDSPNSGSVNKETLYIEGPTMGTQYHIKVVVEKTSDTIGLFGLQTLINERLVDVNRKMSTYISDSELSILNNAEVGEWLPVSQDLFEVLMLSNEVSVASQGTLDITVGPLVNLWGFGPNKTKNIPSNEQINELKADIGFSNIQLLAVAPLETETENTEPELVGSYVATGSSQNSEQPLARVKKAKKLYIDLSAIAKGFACDLLARDFRSMGLNDFMIEIGGELYVSGQTEKSKPWTIGVEKPSLTHEGALQAVAISDVGVATSGDYRNYYEVDGVRASHTLDPTTGKPITHNLVSVTVISESAAKADAYATALNVLGSDRGLTLSNELNLAAYFISRVGDEFVIKYSPAFEQYLVK